MAIKIQKGNLSMICNPRNNEWILCASVGEHILCMDDWDLGNLKVLVDCANAIDMSKLDGVEHEDDRCYHPENLWRNDED